MYNTGQIQRRGTLHEENAPYELRCSAVIDVNHLAVRRASRSFLNALVATVRKADGSSGPRPQRRDR